MDKSGKIIIAITGEIGAGKTTYAEKLKDLGAYPVYADVIAHDILKIDEVKSLIKDSFGKDLFQNNNIDLKILAERAFKDRSGWQRLVEITHPYILKRIEKIVAENNFKYYVIDAPLLFESNLDKEADFIILLKAAPKLRKERLKDRLSWKDAEKRSSYLIPIEKKEELADIVVLNNFKEKRKVEENAEKIFRRIKSKRG